MFSPVSQSSSAYNSDISRKGSHMRLKSLFFISLVFALSLLPGQAVAQVLYGSIVGQVTDPSGASVPNVAVTITDSSTGQSREVTSDSGGRFTISDAQPGVYVLKFEQRLSPD